ncbi:DUF2637 domain-containing protein [Gordonia sihwensis]|uniref:DUF2637 domain-containing protein n=1 Tax=Gordonia sihwensis TaxID=173559 RepID=UPI0005EED5D7|nr:DUF2637 domain-containing protein [Gordonia sihwensis]KJR06061.1 hypothetical protein UG54_14745 [Gordonia sihwensis]
MSRTVKVNTYHKAFGWTLILSFTIISMMLNGVHAVLTMRADGDGWAAFAIALMAVMAPLSMLLTTHLLVGLIQDWTSRRTWLVRLRGVVAAVSGLIAVVSFVLSFAALRDMAILYGEMSTRLAWLVPLIIDAVILAATLAVVVAEAEMRLDREEAVRSTPTIQSAIHPGDPVDDAPDDPAIHPAIHSGDPVSQALIDQAIHADDPVDDDVDRENEAQVRTAIQSDDPVIHTVDDDRDPVDDDLVGQAIHSAIHSGDPVDDGLVDQAIHSAIHSGDPVDDDADDPAIHSAIHPVDDGLDRLAGQVREALGTEADRETIRRALTLDREGLSRRRIAEEVGAAHSTVGRWIKAAEHAEEVRPQPALVLAD